jgi:hypothetical protein
VEYYLLRRHYVKAEGNILPIRRIPRFRRGPEQSPASGSPPDGIRVQGRNGTKPTLRSTSLHLSAHPLFSPAPYQPAYRISSWSLHLYYPRSHRESRAPPPRLRRPNAWPAAKQEEESPSRLELRPCEAKRTRMYLERLLDHYCWQRHLTETSLQRLRLESEMLSRAKILASRMAGEC